MVDDDISIRTYMESMLKACGVGHVIAAESWKEVKDVVGVALIHGAFHDLVLQRSSGLDIARELEKIKVPSVFCSGAVDEFNVAQMLELGWLLPKPVRLAGIKRALDYFLMIKQSCAKQCDDRVFA